MVVSGESEGHAVIQYNVAHYAYYSFRYYSFITQCYWLSVHWFLGGEVSINYSELQL